MLPGKMRLPATGVSESVGEFRVCVLFYCLHKEKPFAWLSGGKGMINEEEQHSFTVKSCGAFMDPGGIYVCLFPCGLNMLG